MVVVVLNEVIVKEIIKTGEKNVLVKILNQVKDFQAFKDEVLKIQENDGTVFEVKKII